MSSSELESDFNDLNCEVCQKKFTYDVIDGKRICKDETCWNQPTCRELYTQTYQCSFCETNQNVVKTPCYIFHHESYDALYKYMCITCFQDAGLMESEREKYSRDQWKFVVNSDLLQEIQNYYAVIKQTDDIIE